MNDKLINILLAELSDIKELLKVIAGNAPKGGVQPIPSPGLVTALRIATDDELKQYEEMSVWDLPFNKKLRVRICNILKFNNVYLVSQLLKISSYYLMNTPNFGQRSRDEVWRVVNELGFDLPGGHRKPRYRG